MSGSFLGAFPPPHKLRKATINFVTSLFVSAQIGRNFKILCWKFSSKSVESYLNKSKRETLHAHKRKFLILRWILLGLANASQRKSKGTLYFNYSFSLSEKSAIYKIITRYMAERDQRDSWRSKHNTAPQRYDLHAE